nr:hypothetical protein CTI12_AA423410, mitochondrial [Tanacetum cinerariifolium]
MCSPYLAFTALTGNQTKEPIHQQPRNESGWSLGTAERKYGLDAPPARAGLSDGYDRTIEGICLLVQLRTRCRTRLITNRLSKRLFKDEWLSLVDFPKQIWALHCMIACRLRMALTASFAAETSMSWVTVLHALDFFMVPSPITASKKSIVGTAIFIFVGDKTRPLSSQIFSIFS